MQFSTASTLCNLLETSVYGIYFVMMQFSTASTLCNLLETSVYGIYFVMMQFSTASTLCNLLETSVYGIYFVMMQFSTALTLCNLLETSVYGIYFVMMQFSTALTLCNLLETSVYGIYFVMMQFSTAGILLSSSLLPTAVLGLGRPTRVSDQRKHRKFNSEQIYSSNYALLIIKTLLQCDIFRRKKKSIVTMMNCAQQISICKNLHVMEKN